jgi:hypothetical protein
MVREPAASFASQWPPSDPAGSSLDAAVGSFLPSLAEPRFMFLKGALAVCGASDGLEALE